VRVGEMHTLVHASKASPLADARFAPSAAWAIWPAEGDHFFS
jgi:hypothetical protein